MTHVATAASAVSALLQSPVKGLEAGHPCGVRLFTDYIASHNCPRCLPNAQQCEPKVEITGCQSNRRMYVTDCRQVSRKTQPARSWSWLSGLHAFGTVLRRDSAPLWLLQVGTPSFGNNHCVKAT